MFLTELFEAAKPQQVIAILPGRFHPFHLGHKSSYEFLADKFGAENTYITTSNKVEPPDSPFSFKDKLKFITATGIDPGHVVQTKNPYNAEELVSKFNPETTALVFGVSAKDMADDPRFNFAPKKDGSPSYFQPYNPGHLLPLSKHGYIITTPTVSFKIAGKTVKSATELRRIFINANATGRKNMVRDMFGNYSPELLNILKTRLGNAQG